MLGLLLAAWSVLGGIYLIYFQIYMLHALYVLCLIGSTLFDGALILLGIDFVRWRGSRAL